MPANVSENVVFVSVDPTEQEPVMTMEPIPVGRIDRLTSFWRRPKWALRCDQHGDLGRFDTQQAATNYWDVHTSAANHTDGSRDG